MSEQRESSDGSLYLAQPDGHLSRRLAKNIRKWRLTGATVRKRLLRLCPDGC